MYFHVKPSVFQSQFHFLISSLPFAEIHYVQFTGRPQEESIVMEVIDNLGRTRLCRNKDSLYPEKVYHVEATYTNEKIFACGGAKTDKCYIYEKDKGWKEILTLPSIWWDGASIPIDGGLVITGGRDTVRRQSSIQIVSLDSLTTSYGPDLPTRVVN